MSEQFDEAKAVEEVKAELEKLDCDDDVASPDTTPAASTPDSEEPPVLKDDAESTLTAEPEEEEAESVPTEPEDGEDDKPALIDSHYRAALRMGMKPEDISDLYDASPELATKTLAKCYEMVNAESVRLGKLGIAQQKAERAKATPVAQPQAQPQPQPSDDRFSRMAAKVKEHYGDDPMAEVLLEILKERQSVQQPQQRQQEPEVPHRSIEEEIAARQQINAFFADPDMEAYEDFYGKNSSVLGDWSHLTPGQRANRIEVCNRAQMILYGAAAAGVEMGTAEALERAHLEVSAAVMEQIVRTRLAKSAKKREKGVTLVSNRRATDTSGSKYDEKHAIAEVAAEMKKVFGT